MIQTYFIFLIIIILILIFNKFKTKGKDYEHIASENVIQIDELFKAFPSQCGFGYQKKCLKCNTWLICSCKKNWFFKYMPNYIKKLKDTKDGIAFYPNICKSCLNGKFNNDFEKPFKMVEFFKKNDVDFYNYCYGAPVSGYEKDMQIRYCNKTYDDMTPELKKEVQKAEIRQKKARKLLNNYIYKTRDVF